MENIDKDIATWQRLVNKLADTKAAELAMRLKIAESILDGKVKGSKTTVIGKYKMTATAKVNTKISREELQSMWKALLPEERQAVKFDPSLIAAEYKKLPNDSILNNAITVKPGTPSLEIKGIVKP